MAYEVNHTSYPLPAYGYRVAVAGRTLGFSEVSGIRAEYDKVTYRHGMSWITGEHVETFPLDSYFPITLKRGLAVGSDPLFLFQWLESREDRPMELSLFHASGTALIVWRIAHAVAVKVLAPRFDASSNEVAIEEVELLVRGVSMAEV